MKGFVIDASVLIKLFFEEKHSETPSRWVKGATRLAAPDLLWVEAANVVWKRSRRGEITAEQAAAVVTDMLRVPVETSPAFDLVASAAALAIDTGRTVYDSLYLALAIRESVPLLTGDERLANALSGGPFAKHIRRVGGK